MAQYFFHYRDGVDDVIDHDGREFAGLNQARQAAIADFRSIVAADAQAGSIDLQARIEICDEAGHVQSAVAATDAFAITMPDGSSPRSAD